jgi:hypothetical protein
VSLHHLLLWGVLTTPPAPCPDPIFPQASRIASFTGSVVNLIFILILSKIYMALAQVLTRWGELGGGGGPALTNPEPEGLTGSLVSKGGV